MPISTKKVLDAKTFIYLDGHSSIYFIYLIYLHCHQSIIYRWTRYGNRTHDERSGHRQACTDVVYITYKMGTDTRSAIRTISTNLSLLLFGISCASIRGSYPGSSSAFDDIYTHIVADCLGDSCVCGGLRPTDSSGHTPAPIDPSYFWFTFQPADSHRCTPGPINPSYFWLLFQPDDSHRCTPGPINPSYFW